MFVILYKNITLFKILKIDLFSCLKIKNLGKFPPNMPKLFIVCKKKHAIDRGKLLKGRY